MTSTSRRGFLRIAGTAALGVALVSCSTRTPPAPPTARPPTSPPPTAPPTTSAAPQPPDWPALRERLTGRLLLPDAPGYRAAATPFNLAVAERQPAAIATCASPADVQACLDVVRSSRIPAAARSGGHSYAGYSTPDGGLVLDLGGMSDVEVRADGTAVIGAGARLGDVYRALGQAGRCLPAGSCATVGISGLTLGGGIGVLTRNYGLTCDRLRSATVVTGDGRQVTASESSEPDLFWALRGGGGGNAGVVTSFEFGTAPAPDLTIFSMIFPARAAADVLGAWQEWIAAAEPELWSNLGLTGGATGCRVGGCFVGSSARLRPLLDDLSSRTGGRAVSRSVQAMGYLPAMRYFAGSSAKEGFVASSRMLAAPLAEPGRVVELLSGRSGLDLLLDGLGGAVSRVAPDATAFPHRTAIASAQVYLGATAASRQSAAGSVGEVQQGLSSLFGPGAYANYLDPNQPDWAQAYYGANLPRLKQIAQRYDPDSLLAFPQSVTRA